MVEGCSRPLVAGGGLAGSSIVASSAIVWVMKSTHAIDRRSVAGALCGPGIALVAGIVLLLAGGDESLQLLGGYAVVISITGFAAVAGNVRDAMRISWFLDDHPTLGAATTHYAPAAASSSCRRRHGAPLSAEPQVFRPDWWSRVLRPAGNWWWRS